MSDLACFNTVWRKVEDQPSLRFGYALWSRLANGIDIFIVHPDHTTPTVDNGGYYNLESAIQYHKVVTRCASQE